MPNQKRARQKAARARKLEEQRRIARRNSLIKRIVIVVVVAGVVLGTAAAFLTSGGHSTTTSSTTADQRLQATANTTAVAAGCPASPTTPVNTLHWKHAPKMTIDVNRYYYATFDTTAGTFVVQLDPKEAPVTVNNFVFLAEHKYYNCNSFFRVIPNFMEQGGAPEQVDTDSTQPGYTIPDEFQKHPGKKTFPLESIVMANTGAKNSGGSQFFIVTGPDGEGLPNSYTLFGKVVSGLNVPIIIQDYGNSSSTANGIPPLVIERMLTVTISTKAP